MFKDELDNQVIAKVKAEKGKVIEEDAMSAHEVDLTDETRAEKDQRVAEEEAKEVKRGNIHVLHLTCHG